MGNVANHTISVGICAHNEEETIGKLIDQIFQEEISLEEVIVVIAGNDNTASIVQSKMDKYKEITLIEEETREGQSSAQNKILNNATGELLFLVDGDGLIKKGSMEEMLQAYDGSSIIHSREIPIVEEKFLGSVIQTLWNLHHRLCMEKPKFSTQLGLMPSNLVDHIPEDIVLDDAYIESKAYDKGCNVVYLPEAVKYHKTPNKIMFYICQREKNWAGLWQLDKKGHSRKNNVINRLKAFTKYFLNSSVKTKVLLLVVVALELIGISKAYKDKTLSDWPVIWYRDQ